MAFSGLGLHLGNLSRLSNALTRSISPENFTGEKGKGGMSVDGPAAPQARDLGQGWKVSPFVVIEPGATFTLADIDRKSTRLNSSHVAISYAVFCLKKKKQY